MPLVRSLIASIKVNQATVADFMILGACAPILCSLRLTFDLPAPLIGTLLWSHRFTIHRGTVALQTNPMDERLPKVGAPLHPRCVKSLGWIA